MATKVEQTSLLERRRNQSSASPATTPVTAANSPKISMRAVKAGVSFVIPKNKLSGALVPVVRSGGKVEKIETKKDEEVKQPLRKTKWGIDLTQDAAVRRGRALAYQTRAEQIAAQLESGNLENDLDEATRSPSPPPIYDSSGQRTNTREARKREQLDLEMREAIGECMCLNLNYKPPAGYRPVCKEAKIYIPVKETLGHNFVSLILGPQGNTKKRLEEETGTRITIKGRAEDAKEGQATDGVGLDGKEAESINEDLHVHISADTYEKVDAAISLLELLMTPVDGNIPPSGADTPSSLGDGSKAPEEGVLVANTSHFMPNSDLIQNYAQQMSMRPPERQPTHLVWPSSATGAPNNIAWPSAASATEAPRSHLLSHPGNWHSMGANNSAMQSHSGLSGAPGTSPYSMNNANMFISRTPHPTYNSFPQYPLFRGRPPAPGFNMHAMPSNVRNPMLGPVNRPRPPFHVQQRPYMEMASQNQSATGIFGNPRPSPVIGLPSQASQAAVHHNGPNAAPLPPSSNIIGGGGYGPHVPYGRQSASAPPPVAPFSSVLPPAVPSQAPASQPYSGPQQQQLQHPQPPSLFSQSGTVVQVHLQGLSSVAPQGAHTTMLPPVVSPVMPSPGSLPTALRGAAHAAAPPTVASPLLPSPGFSPGAPQGAHPAVPSPVFPSPRLPPSAPQGTHMAVPPPVASAVPLSPGLPPPAPRAAHVALPPQPASSVPPSPGLSPAPPQSAAVAVPPVFPSPPVPPAGNIHHIQPSMSFNSQGSSVGPSSVALPVLSAPPTPASPIPSGTMHRTAVNPSGIAVATVQSVGPSRPIVPPPVSAGITYTSSQGSSVPSSAAPSTWQPQHLSSGDFTFQPLRSQAPSAPPSAWPSPSRPPLSDAPPKIVPIIRPGSQPAVPNLPHSHPGQIRVTAPLPPAPATSVPPAPPVPPLPPQAPSFRPAISLPPLPLSNSSQPTFSIPSKVCVSQTIGMVPPRPGFLGSSQQMPPRSPGILTSPAFLPFGSSASHTIHPVPPQPRPQSRPDSFLTFPPVPSVPNFPRQEAPASQPFRSQSASNVSIPPTGPRPPLVPSAAFPGNVPNQGGGSAFAQQQSNPAVFPSTLAVPTNNVIHNHMMTSPQVQLPSSPQVRSTGPIQMHDFGYGGGSSKTLPASTGEGGSSQSYDPFSPTSIPPEQLHPQSGQTLNMPSNTGEAPGRQETDAEYENLMESVGVR